MMSRPSFNIGLIGSSVPSEQKDRKGITFNGVERDTARDG